MVRVVDAANWPSAGSVTFTDVVMRYKPQLPAVLRRVTFTVAGGEKVGVVGRTGAGKSSLLSCLFRIVEVQQGSVTVDGVDAAALPLWRLRRALAIIPQTPVLFSGTLRFNVDVGRAAMDGAERASGSSDGVLWGVLQSVGLAEYVKSLPGGLDTAIEEVCVAVWLID